MAVERLEITRREPYLDGRAFPGGGAYERVDALAHYAVDPEHAANRRIVDLDLAPRGDDGRVRFSGDVTLLLPAAGGNRALLLEAPNRGNRILTRSFNRAPFELVPTDHIDPGDGFLMRHGWTLGWCGWQWDVPKPSPRLGLAAPRVPAAALGDDTPMQLRLQPDRPTPCFALTDHHVGSIGNHRPIPARDAGDPAARLLVREHLHAAPETIPRERWRFARDDDGAPVADAAHVWLDGGFRPGLIYDLLYTPAECPVTGAGLLALRDLAAFLRRDARSPLAGRVDHVIGEGISQCGRLLRSFLHLGLNADESREPAFDGLLVHIAGGRRGEFNHRYAQPSVQPTPGFGQLFPFADAPQHDPLTGREAGLLDAQRAAGCMPRIVYTDTSAEYWRGDAALAHLQLDGARDAEPPPGVRRYLFAGTQHGPGVLPFADVSMFGSHGSNAFNVVDYRPLLRAALANLLAWVRAGVEPPPSVFPRVADGTAVTRDAAIAALAGIPGLALPAPDRLPAIFPLDLGPDAARGIGRFPAGRTGPAYPALVSAVDTDGNETGGVRMPDISVAVATHTGFNVRHPDSGGAGQILEYVGLTLPFPRDDAARGAAGDPRASIASRYAGRDDYLARVRDAAAALVADRLLLAEDVEVCVAIAAERWDACTA